MGRNRVNRGGSWNDDGRNCRSAYRNANDPGNRNDNLGFRVCLARSPNDGPAAGTTLAGPLVFLSAVSTAANSGPEAATGSAPEGAVESCGFPFFPDGLEDREGNQL